MLIFNVTVSILPFSTAKILQLVLGSFDRFFFGFFIDNMARSINFSTPVGLRSINSPVSKSISFFGSPPRTGLKPLSTNANINDFFDDFGNSSFLSSIILGSQ